MQNKNLLFWILGADKKPHYINASDHVEVGDGVTQTDGTTPANLAYSPDGWNETLVKYGRSNKYWGLFRDFTVPLNFVKDGAKILRNAMWKQGMEAVLYLAISKLNRTAFPDTYDPWYAGEFDFSKFKQTQHGIDINIMEGGLSKLLKANEGTTYEIDVKNDPERFSLYFDGIPFTNKVENSIFEQEIAGAAFTPGSEYWVLGTGVISNEGTSQGVITGDQAQSSDQAPNSPNCFFTSVSKNITINISGSIYVKNFLSGTSSIKVFIHKHTSDGVFLSEYVIVPIQNISGLGTSFTVSYSFTIPFEPGTKATLYARIATVSTPGGIVNIVGTMNYNYDVIFDSTLCECLIWKRVFEKLTEKLTDGKYGCKSSFLDSLDGSQVLTCGQAIRRFQDPVNPQYIKTSMNDFFKALQHWGCGLGIENDTLVIERHEYFFGKDISMHLGEVKDLEIVVAEDLEFNSIKVGYQNKTYDSINGKDEFNVTQGYTTPHTRIVKELDLVSPYRADMFGIELTRLKMFGKDTTDNIADNDTFMINVIKGTDYDYFNGSFQTQVNTGSYFVLIPTVKTPLANGTIISFSGNDYTILNTSYLIDGFTFIQVLEPVTNATLNTTINVTDPNIYKLYRPAYSSITGLLQPAKAFNTELTPKHALLNNGALLHSLLDYQDSKEIVFQTGEKNSELSTTLAGVTIAQKANVSIASLPAKLFLPYYAKFKTKVEVDLPGMMRLKPYDKVSFDYDGNTYTGFVWDAGMAPADDDAQTWQLLMAPENDMKKLI